MFKTIKNIHFVGIGGSGMSGIAEVLINLGYKVSGSDLKESEVTARLARLGARIHYGHKESNVGDAQVVVTSTAVRPENPEVRLARKNKIPVIPRIEMLAELARLKYTIAVAGTHGKTTTTSMVAAIFQEAGWDPTFIIGGRVKHLESGAKLGSGEFLVAEADESDGSFLKLSPAVGIITNIDNDHLDYYQTTRRLKDAFIQFANRVPFYGMAIVCADDPGVMAVLPSFTRKVVTYGLKGRMDYTAADVRTGPAGVRYKLVRNGRAEGEVVLNLSGKHNILNSLAAAACGLELGVPFEKLAKALGDFESVGRRFEKRGEKNGAVWIDDYGHHPTEIRAVMQALRERYPDKTIVVAFQPHRYSRTKILMKDFGSCFAGADRVVLLPIYAAGEKPIPGVDSKKLIPAIRRSKVAVDHMNGSGYDLAQFVTPGHVFVTLGAGDVWKLGEKIFK
ncbi:MAG: UDP-N-acetylmuramate--L-alanine ligase [Elusimicrobia bacterium RIFCSPLOWO2_01_FULL_60_11]|nr:MAG: UDP-N-acetylmuramate--L-alanine ligase [Elusimicrobia bacterium RIFCSPLOWO2_01_FULL_60_11]